jgi:hypothetical protein
MSLPVGFVVSIGIRISRKVTKKRASADNADVRRLTGLSVPRPPVPSFLCRPILDCRILVLDLLAVRTRLSRGQRPRSPSSGRGRGLFGRELVLGLRLRIGSSAGEGNVQKEHGNDDEDHQPPCPLHGRAGLRFHYGILGLANEVVKRVAAPGMSRSRSGRFLTCVDT